MDYLGRGILYRRLNFGFFFFIPFSTRRWERGNVDKFKVPPGLQYTIVNVEETLIDQCVPHILYCCLCL